MANEVVKSIRNDIEQLEVNIREAEDMIALAKAAGEDVSSQENELKTQRIRREKWKRALDAYPK